MNQQVQSAHFASPQAIDSYVDQRNILVLCVSEDLFTWQIVEIILQDDTGFSELDSILYTGFHCTMGSRHRGRFTDMAACL
jgi:hypothetical protein